MISGCYSVIPIMRINVLFTLTLKKPLEQLDSVSDREFSDLRVLVLVLRLDPVVNPARVTIKYYFFINTNLSYND